MPEPLLTLSALTLNGVPVAGSAPTAQFDPRGGTVGRADTNHLVLVDPERTVSRVHAQIAWRGGNYVLIDRGSNPVLVNGRSLEPGQEVPMAHGDQVQIGGYLLRADVGDGDSTQMPRAPAPAPASAAPVDLFAGLGAPAASSDDPFADLLAPAPSPAPRPAPPGGHAPPPGPAASALPDDDPFADLLSGLTPPPGAAPAGGAAPPATGSDPFALLPAAPGHDDLGLGDPNAGARLDDLFDLGAAGRDVDPFADSALRSPVAAPNTSAGSDPLASLLGTDTPPPAASIPDDGFELHAAFTPPRAATPPAAPPGPDPLAAFAPVPPPLAAPAPRPAPAPARTPAAGDDALLAALRAGLGAPELPLPPLTPELAYTIGVLLRESTQGTLDLLMARAATKREVRADATMIVAKENNPLKFSPNVEVALQHLFAATPARGFMPAPDAMRDAYDDLRAHQFGFMAGMRAALTSLLERFEPARLEQRLARNNVMDKLPMARRARLWDLFTQMYGDISREAADNFHQAFGQAFLKAYQEQIDRLDTQRDGDR